MPVLNLWGRVNVQCPNTIKGMPIKLACPYSIEGQGKRAVSKDKLRACPFNWHALKSGF